MADSIPLNPVRKSSKRTPYFNSARLSRYGRASQSILPMTYCTNSYLLLTADIYLLRFLSRGLPVRVWCSWLLACYASTVDDSFAEYSLLTATFSLPFPSVLENIIVVFQIPEASLSQCEDLYLTLDHVNIMPDKSLCCPPHCFVVLHFKLVTRVWFSRTRLYTLEHLYTLRQRMTIVSHATSNSAVDRKLSSPGTQVPMDK